MLVTSCSGEPSAAANSPPPSTIPTTNGCRVVPLTAIVLLPCVEMLPLTGAFHGRGKPTGMPVGASTGYAAAGNGNETSLHDTLVRVVPEHARGNRAGGRLVEIENLRFRLVRRLLVGLDKRPVLGHQTLTREGEHPREPHARTGVEIHQPRRDVLFERASRERRRAVVAGLRRQQRVLVGGDVEFGQDVLTERGRKSPRLRRLDGGNPQCDADRNGRTQRRIGRDADGVAD